MAVEMSPVGRTGDWGPAHLIPLGWAGPLLLDNDHVLCDRRRVFTSTFPTKCVERFPTTQTRVFAGVPISLSAIAHAYEPPLDIPYLSRVFNRRITPGLKITGMIAEALGMEWRACALELLEGIPEKYQKGRQK